MVADLVVLVGMIASDSIAPARCRRSHHPRPGRWFTPVGAGGGWSLKALPHEPSHALMAAEVQKKCRFSLRKYASTAIRFYNRQKKRLKFKMAANSISFVTFTIPKYPKRPDQTLVAAETMVVRGIRTCRASSTISWRTLPGIRFHTRPGPLPRSTRPASPPAVVVSTNRPERNVATGCAHASLLTLVTAHPREILLVNLSIYRNRTKNLRMQFPHRMKKIGRRQALHGLSILTLGTLITVSSIPGSAQSKVRPKPLDLVFDANWRGDKIGTHEIKVTPLDGESAWRTEVVIDMKVDLGLFGDISFKHECTEIWREGRLMELDSKTDDDGSVFSVSGQAKGKDFAMKGPGGPRLVPGNLLTSSSAWSVEVCQQQQLIDVTHGDIIGLVASQKGVKNIDTAQGKKTVQRYAVMSPLIAGDLVYDRNGIWLGGRLERSGASIDYALKSL